VLFMLKESSDILFVCIQTKEAMSEESALIKETSVYMTAPTQNNPGTNLSSILDFEHIFQKVAYRYILSDRGGHKSSSI
jgi:hypothetical protein